VAGYAERGLHGQIVHELGGRIVTGRFAPGDVIDLSVLEGELGVSRTVLRESLKVLAAKGLVDARQKRGTFVRQRDDWNMLDADVIHWRSSDHSDHSLLDDLDEVRAIIEPAGARLAAQRRTEADLDALEGALTAMAEAYRADGADADPAAGDPQPSQTDMVAADLAFHRALLCATHNELLQRMEMVIESDLATRDRLVHGAPSAQDPVPIHREVLDAVREQDPVRAERAMNDLLAQARHDMQVVQDTSRRRAGRKKTQ
jgi:GntR family transcriptional regulator, galactonate operon transcriptional repressor